MDAAATQDTCEARADREAGHAAMAQLAVEAGIADHLFAAPIAPGDRVRLVPEPDLPTEGSTS